MAEQREKEPVVQAAARRVASRWINGLGRVTLALLALGTVAVIHLVGLLIFTNGFLLTRLSIPAVSPAYNATNPPPVPPSFEKAVIVIIDALRTDFISPNYPTLKSEYHHGVLSLPTELSEKDPSHSLIFNSYSDPPTTTMQRIKGITTGSLPTFIDAGANFASTAIEEDSLVQQLLAVNKSIAFMGDDTWMGLFPDKFKHAHPYDSFNVEDLHTVDNGVIEHIFPYLAPENRTEWDVLIGHFLGVDHVGHRVGPERETMRQKLKQMDDVLRDVVDKLDDKTLLVVLGDHGMNPKGDHGGDSDLETAAALWMYSKGPALTGPAINDFDWPTYTFPGSTKPIRHVNQIDLVPTLALLLGIPIPYNNIGAPIPEPFSSSLGTLAAASGATAQQIERYVKAYGNREVATNLLRLRRNAADDSLEGAIKHNYAVCATALSSLRALWAQFSVTHIVVGLGVLALGVLASLAMYLGVRNSGPRWDAYVRFALDTALTAGAGVGSVAGTLAGVYTRKPAVALQVFFVAMAVVESVVLAAPLFTGHIRSITWNLGKSVGPLVLLLHCLSFASNSFIMWEDRMVLFLLVTVLVVHMAQSFTAPTASQRLRILLFALVFAVIARLLSLVTVCREEQQPYCQVTFYSQGAGQPNWALAFAFLSAVMFFPRFIATVLDWSKSYAGPAPLFVAVFWRVVIVVNTMYWVLDFCETWDGLNPDRIPLAKMLKQWAARLSLGAVLGALPYLWWGSGLCIRAEKETDQATGEEAGADRHADRAPDAPRAGGHTARRGRHEAYLHNGAEGDAGHFRAPGRRGGTHRPPVLQRRRAPRAPRHTRLLRHRPPSCPRHYPVEERVRRLRHGDVPLVSGARCAQHLGPVPPRGPRCAPPGYLEREPAAQRHGPHRRTCAPGLPRFQHLLCRHCARERDLRRMAQAPPHGVEGVCPALHARRHHAAHCRHWPHCRRRRVRLDAAEGQAHLPLRRHLR